MPKDYERMRWRIASLLDKLPGQCWANLVGWALGDGWWPWRPVDDVCRRDAARCGACYCAKIRAAQPGVTTRG